MRKGNSQLTLRRETLRNFAVRELARIQGGAFEAEKGTQAATCGCPSWEAFCDTLTQEWA
jgi:hypothetical protein